MKIETFSALVRAWSVLPMPTSDQDTSDQGEKTRFRKCCFTQHDEAEPLFSEKLGYLGYAKETCPSTGKTHWQGFAYGKLLMSLKVWKKLFPGAHIEQMRSDFAVNEKYCSKEGQLIEHGVRPRQGERTDLNELKVQLDAGRKPLEIADEVEGMFGVVAKHHKFAETYYQYKRQKTKAQIYT